MAKVGLMDPYVEVCLGGLWTDITGDVRYQGGRGIDLQTGSTPESPQVNSYCRLQLDDRSGTWSPRNATGANYGKLLRNTPIRVGSRIVHDLDRSRTASNGWGTGSEGTPTAYAWSTTGTAGDYAVTAGVGTHSLSSTASRLSYMSVMDMSNVEARFTFQLPFSNTTGGSVFTNIALRGTGAGVAWYRAQVAVTAAEAVTVQAIDTGGAAVGSPTTVAGLTHSGQALRVAAHMDGETMRVKVWQASDSEPYSWALEVHGLGVTLSEPVHGWVGIESSKAAGNSNGTFSVSYTNVEVRSQRFEGETSEWPLDPEESGNDLVVNIEAAGQTRRYRAGTEVLRSPMYRAFHNAPSLVAYWPCEEGSGATEFASALTGGGTLDVLSGTPRLASDSIFSASQPLPVVAKSVWEGLVNGYGIPSPDVIQWRWIQRIDIGTAEPPDTATIIRFKNFGSAYFYIIRYNTGGSLTLEVQDYFGSIVDSDVLSLEVRNIGGRCSFTTTQNGGNVDWAYTITDVDTQVTQTATGSTAGQTIGMAGGVAVGSDGTLDAVTIGHIMCQTASTATLDYASAVFGWQGEAAPARPLRVLGTEEGIPYQPEGDTSKGPAMGTQPLGAPIGIWDQAQVVNQGIQFEPVYRAGIGYITFGSLVNRAERVTLDYSTGQLFGKLQIVDDDLLTENNVVVTKSDTSDSPGSTVTATQTTGPMSTLAPGLGGIGPVSKPHTVNVYTIADARNVAGFLLFRGTLDKPRLPAVKMLLANPRITASPALFQSALDLREGGFHKVTGLQTRMIADSIRTVVIGRTERLTQFEHDITWAGLPGEMYVATRVSDGATRRSRVQASAIYLNANINSTTFTVVVKSLDGFLLSTTAVPYDITLGGERMTVTACVGAASPQTLTVTRSVNGVVKAQVADDSNNARIRIYDGARVSLS
jgi:hypothetical protein